MEGIGERARVREGGREGKKRSMRGGGGSVGGGAMQAQSVTEIERFHEQGRERKGDTGRGRVAEFCRQTRGSERKEEERGRRRAGGGGEKMMEPRSRLRRTALHPRSVRQT